MRKNKNILSILLASITLVFSGCNKNPTTYTEYSFSINRNEIVMELGDTFNLIAVSGNQKVAYSTNDSSIASVTSEGLITANKEGTTFINASVNGETLSCKVTVIKRVYEITFNKDKNITVAKNATIEIIAKQFCDGVEKQAYFSWSITNQSNCYFVATNEFATFRSDVDGVYIVTASTNKSANSVTITVLDM